MEVKSFLGPSDVRDLEEALGQFMVYELVLREVEPERTLFLAVPEKAWNSIFSDALGDLVLRARAVRPLVLDPTQEVITRWIPSKPGETSSSAS